MKKTPNDSLKICLEGECNAPRKYPLEDHQEPTNHKPGTNIKTRITHNKNPFKNQLPNQSLQYNSKSAVPQTLTKPKTSPLQTINIAYEARDHDSITRLEIQTNQEKSDQKCSLYRENKRTPVIFPFPFRNHAAKTMQNLAEIMFVFFPNAL